MRRIGAATRGVAVAIGMVAALSAAAPAGVPKLAAVARIEPGLWQIKTLDSDAAPRALCVADPATLLHFGRAATACSHVVVDDLPDLATVQYRCTGSGTGRTVFHVATPRAFDLEIQGIADGAPYEEHYEAHRLGACTAGAR